MKKPIRVLHIVTHMNRAGLESRLMDIYRNMDRKLIQFDFYTCRLEKGVFDDEIKALGGVVYYNKELTLSRIAEIPKRFERFFDEHTDYKIVHCHLNQWCGLILKGAYKAGVPHRIAHSRTSLEANNLKNTVKNTIKKSTTKYANHYFAVSEKAGNWLFGKQLMQSGQVEVLPNAIDCNMFRYDEQQREKTRDKLNVLCQFVLINVGNLRFEKNQIFLLEIVSELTSLSESIKLLFVGDGELKNRLLEEAERLNVASKVDFLGSRSDVAELLQAADVFVFPSLYEGFPGAVLEAEASGIPCIVSDRITTEVCINDNVIRLPINDAQLWRNKIMDLYLSQSKNHRNRSENIKTELYQYDIHRLVDIMSQLYISYSES